MISRSAGALTMTRTLPSGAARHIGFGHPAIRGISTSAIFEHIEGGEDDEDVAAQFDLELEDVGWARSYELSCRSATRAA